MCRFMQTMEEARISPVPTLMPLYSMKSPTLNGTMLSGSGGLKLCPLGRFVPLHLSVFPEYGIHIGYPENEVTEGLAVSAIQCFFASV